MSGSRLALAVPCYNEASRLVPESFHLFLTTHPDAHLVLVDDGSEDGTNAILESIRAAAPASVTVLRHSVRSGKAEAVRTGIRAGLDRKADLVGFLDADLSTPLAVVDDCLAVFAARPAVEFILGSRVMLMGRDIRRRPARHYLGRIFATAVSLALDLPVYDTQCGAKMLRVTADTATLFATPFRSPWIFDVELIGRYLRLPVAPGEPSRRDRLYELVLPVWHDRPGSKLRWYDFARAVVDLGYIWRERVAHAERGAPADSRRVSDDHPAAPRDGAAEESRRWAATSRSPPLPFPAASSWGRPRPRPVSRFCRGTSLVQGSERPATR